MAENGQKRDPTSHRTPKQESQHWDRYGKKHKDKNRKRKEARRILEKEGLLRKHDGLEADHKHALRHGGGNTRSNLRVRAASKNRAHGSPAGGRATRGRRGS